MGRDIIGKAAPRGLQDHPPAPECHANPNRSRAAFLCKASVLTLPLYTAGDVTGWLHQGARILLCRDRPPRLGDDQGGAR